MLTLLLSLLLPVSRRLMLGQVVLSNCVHKVTESFSDWEIICNVSLSPPSVSLTATVSAKVPAAWVERGIVGGSCRKKSLASLAKLESFHSIEPDICPRAEHVCYPNDLSCCFIIRDIDGGGLPLVHLALTKLLDSLLAKTMYSHLGELMCRSLNAHSSPSPSQFPKYKTVLPTNS